MSCLAAMDGPEDWTAAALAVYQRLASWFAFASGGNKAARGGDGGGGYRAVEARDWACIESLKLQTVFLDGGFPGGRFRRSCELLVNDSMPLQPAAARAAAVAALGRRDAGFFYAGGGQADRGLLTAFGAYLGLRLLSAVLAGRARPAARPASQPQLQLLNLRGALSAFVSLCWCDVHCVCLARGLQLQRVVGSSRSGPGRSQSRPANGARHAGRQRNASAPSRSPRHCGQSWQRVAGRAGRLWRRRRRG